jgi:DNA invertase Pin-like site-specific DNA recombinase
MSATRVSGKIAREHLSRDAIVYIRQSRPHQVRDNRESGERQYNLVERATALGWPAASITTIDEDQGRTATAAEHRHGFKKLLAEISAGQVGIVLALEASRLARSSADWHRLIEICGITRTLLADETAVYDPRDPNDRLLLGVKGTISEAELFTLRCRLHEGRWNKARRGALTRSLPAGFVKTESGSVMKDPDRSVRARLDYLFRQFDRLGVAHKVLLHFREQGLTLPTKIWGGPRHGQIVWKMATFPAIVRILHNPTYAGTYVYGQCEYDPFDRSPKTGKARPHGRPPEDWPVCIHGAYPSYITWEKFLENRRLLRANWFRHESRGAPRKGAALLQGIVFCGRCGSKMGIQHYATKEKRSPAYTCYHAYQNEGAAGCQCMSATGVDRAVTDLFLGAVSPAKVEIALRALEGWEQDRQAVRKQRELQIQQAEYEMALARKRYEAVDPANRLVAGELESQWEQALKALEELRRSLREWEQNQGGSFGPKERGRLKELSVDLERVWKAATTTAEDRKTLLRFLVKRVHLDGVTEPGRIRIEVEWHTGASSALTIDRPLVGVWAPRTPDKVVRRIKELLACCTQAEIAAKLNEEGLLSAKGKRFNMYTVGYVIRSRGWGQKGDRGQEGGGK